jgi:hypothetical protein
LPTEKGEGLQLFFQDLWLGRIKSPNLTDNQIIQNSLKGVRSVENSYFGIKEITDEEFKQIGPIFLGYIKKFEAINGKLTAKQLFDEKTLKTLRTF